MVTDWREVGVRHISASHLFSFSSAWHPLAAVPPVGLWQTESEKTTCRWYFNMMIQNLLFKTHFILQNEWWHTHKSSLKTKEVAQLQTKTKNLHHPQRHEETDPRAWWSCFSSPPQAPFCNPALGSRHRSDNHLLIYHCYVVSCLFALKQIDQCIS